jgi:hemolysin III
MVSRPQSFAEELANSISHGCGFLGALISGPVLIAVMTQQGQAVNIVGASVFAVTMVLLYLVSAFYHAVPAEWASAKQRWAKLDHSAIYLFIAGSYTPFTLGVLSGVWGWTLFGLIWALAALGVLLKAFDKLAHPLLSTGLYLAMGWLIVVAAGPLLVCFGCWPVASLIPWAVCSTSPMHA